MDLLAGLNSPQREAVTHVKGPLLIFAGAGSGKTRTLTHRIAYLIREHRVPPGRILAVTFTNKAAKEMRERLTHLVGNDASRIWMGTFHAMCAQMLRINGDLIGIDRRFVIFDNDDTLRLMKEILKEADIDTSRYPPSRILHRISDAKNNLRSPQDVESVASSPYQRVLARVYTRYQERLQAAHALDFDDLLGEAVRLLRESEEARHYWSERFLHVLIDEFQDVNMAQFRWAQMLAEKHRNICVVGDDDQSIYAWRGANVKIILDFEVSYQDATVIHLEQNYRSTQNILDAAHGVISQNIGRKAKRLWTEVEGGATLTVHGAINAQEEALWVVRKVQSLQRLGHEHLSDFAILCRVNAQSRPFEEAFMRARVPLKLVGTQRFYDRKEVKDLVAYLKVIYNANDSVALARIINVPGRGIGDVTIQKLQWLAAESNRSLYEVILDAEAVNALGRAVAAKIAPLRNLLKTLQEEAQVNNTVADLVRLVIDRTDYLEHLRRERTVDSIDRQANVQEFINAAEQFDMRMDEMEEPEAADEEDQELLRTGDADLPEGIKRLGTFMESVALEGDAEGGTGAGSNEAVTLMTLHSAKGLEFPIVFLAGMEQGLLPHARALWGEQAGEEELEEERRLCYVGLTRAQQQVFLTFAAQRTLQGRTESTQPSQFLDEIPSHLVERAGLAAANAPSAYDVATSWNRPGVSSTFRPAGVAASSSAEPPKFSIGDRLRHPTFGEGLVVNASPSGGAGEWVEVAFLNSETGKKKLVVAYAPLEKV
ncbi:MAG: UvrD-helicase domain-containing protein [Abitibacteriaceae bacterium]|nr:UvrD-helicase domain-containing protein [Abditibacteriaceae bacterium]